MTSTLRTSLDDASTTYSSSNKVGKSGAKQERAKDDEEIPREGTKGSDAYQQEPGQEHRTVAGDLLVGGEASRHDSL
jgi:hypothetical protein